MRKYVLGIVVGLAGWGVGCGVPPPVEGLPVETGPGGDGPCPAVVVSARPAGGGACREFGDPCKVPQGYITCCSPSTQCFGSAQCVDDPLDSCDPRSGATNCQHICQ